MRIILASNSPRRRELISKLGLAYIVKTLSIKEVYDKNISAFDNAVHTAEEKAKRVYTEGIDNHDIIIAADTIVEFDGEVFGKPRDKKHAYYMLKALSANTHKVITGVSMMSKNKRESFYETSLVEFAKLSDEEINHYIETGEPYDKAGAYGIQGKAGIFIKRISGCYYNIVGLPVNAVYKRLINVFGCDIKEIF